MPGPWCFSFLVLLHWDLQVADLIFLCCEAECQHILKSGWRAGLLPAPPVPRKRFSEPFYEALLEKLSFQPLGRVLWFPPKARHASSISRAAVSFSVWHIFFVQLSPLGHGLLGLLGLGAPAWRSGLVLGSTTGLPLCGSDWGFRPEL